MRSRFAVFQLRELLLIVLPVVLVAAGTIWFALRLVDPAPPGVFVVSAASTGSQERHSAGSSSRKRLAVS